LVLVRSVWTARLADITPDAQEMRAMEEAEGYLADLQFKLMAQGLHVATAIPYAPADEGILMEIELRQADLVVMSTHGRSGLSRLVYGSVAEAILARSPVPVLLVRVGKGETTQTTLPSQPHILVPLDGSTFGEAALPHATELARVLDGTLILLRVVIQPTPRVDPFMPMPYPAEETMRLAEADARAYLGDVATNLQAEGLRVKTVFHVGHAATVILHEEQGTADLVVMATHGRTGLAQAVFGSVAKSVLHHGDLPLLLVRPRAMIQPAPETQVAVPT
jgi:nucleotide-binding universal stress UspA family protein